MLVEAPMDTDVEIVRSTWVYGGKRLIEPSSGWFFSDVSLRIAGAEQLCKGND